MSPCERRERGGEGQHRRSRGWKEREWKGASKGEARDEEFNWREWVSEG